MASLAVLFTFLAAVLGVAGLVATLSHTRTKTRLLLQNDPLAQQATSYRAPGLIDRLVTEATQAGLSLTRRSFVMIWGCGAGLGLLFFLLGDPMFGSLFPLAAGGIPVIWIRRRARKRTELFAEQLPGALTLMANTMRAGGSLYHAVGAVTRQMPDPVRSEFARIEKAIQLQIPIAEALAKARDRIGVTEFASVVVACKVAGEAGADLDVVLESIAREIVEERQFIKALEGASADGRASARLVTLVPAFIMGAVVLLNPSYILGSLRDPTVLMLYAGAVGLILFGWIMIRQLTDVRNW